MLNKNFLKSVALVAGLVSIQANASLITNGSFESNGADFISGSFTTFAAGSGALLGWARTRASQFGLTEKTIARAMLLAGPQAAPDGAVADDSLAKANRLAVPRARSRCSPPVT